MHATIAIQVRDASKLQDAVRRPEVRRVASEDWASGQQSSSPTSSSSGRSWYSSACRIWEPLPPNICSKQAAADLIRMSFLQAAQRVKLP